MDEFVKELGNVFWGKLTFVKRQEEVPKYGDNIQAFNFISNILSPSKQRPDGKERPIKDKTPSNLPIDMKKYMVSFTATWSKWRIKFVALNIFFRPRSLHLLN